MSIKALKYSTIVGLIGFGIDYSAVQYVDFRNALPGKVHALKQNIQDDVADTFGYEPKEGEVTAGIIEQVSQAAVDADVEPALARAVLKVESAKNPEAFSKAGAIGLMQIMPFNAEFCDTTPKKLWRKDVNIACGLKILKSNLKKTGGNKEMALRLYNGGSRGLSNPLPETKKYVGLVMTAYRKERA